MDYCYTRPLQDCFFIGDVGTLIIANARRDDAAPSVFYLRDLRSKFVRTAAARVRRLALKHQMAGMIDVTEVPIPPEA